MSKSDCDCIEKINKKLKETRPTANLRCTMFDVRPVMYYDYYETTKTGKRRSKEGIFLPSYCPFCGKKYKEN